MAVWAAAFVVGVRPGRGAAESCRRCGRRAGAEAGVDTGWGRGCAGGGPGGGGRGKGLALGWPRGRVPAPPGRPFVRRAGLAGPVLGTGSQAWEGLAGGNREALSAASPAPLSTASSAPNASNFLTVSGVADTRLSIGSLSLRTAIFKPGRPPQVIAMMAITTSSSIRVNPRLRALMGYSRIRFKSINTNINHPDRSGKATPSRPWSAASVDE